MSIKKFKSPKKALEYLRKNGKYDMDGQLHLDEGIKCLNNVTVSEDQAKNLIHTN